MNQSVIFFLRSFAQFAYGWLASWLASVGLNIGDSGITEAGILAVSVAFALVVLRWLETRQGETLWPRLARGVASVLMLGLSRSQPVYAPSAAETGGTPTRVGYDNGVSRSVSG